VVFIESLGESFRLSCKMVVMGMVAE